MRVRLSKREMLEELEDKVASLKQELGIQNAEQEITGIDYMKRVKVPGGWIVKQEGNTCPDCRVTLAMCYVPDPNHEWEV